MGALLLLDGVWEGFWRGYCHWNRESNDVARDFWVGPRAFRLWFGAYEVVAVHGYLRGMRDGI